MMNVFKNKKNKEKGVIALVTLLIISALLVISGTTLLLTTIDITKVTKNFSNVILTELQADTCLEESLLKISNNTNFTGTINLTTTNGTCSSQITNNAQNPSLKNVTITGTIQEYNFQRTLSVDISVSPIKIAH